MVDFQSRDTRRHDEDEESVETEPGRESEDSTPTDETGRDDDHRTTDEDHHAHDVDTLGAAVVTVSSSRSLSDDPSGDAIVAGLEDAGHKVVSRDLIDDDYDGVQGSVNALVGRDDVDAVVTTGGTGVTPDDVTIEAVEQLFDKELPGFGELFRLLSHDEIGTKVVGTRATAGVVDGVVVFCLPGSENAARLGVEQIIVEEADHLAGLASREE
ncbi:MogA/MoaB family molybdenum cofactor biosynthesis protein [Halorussus limi]|uniref:MogA/MoaB family molybdenum cofactor biosynthesis protein n=1 Tax=Halorussus limi TaxID=2938695 RepID=A0A8U0HVZ0_9EURY|nr:MogA/MoaB family molybdenum cofactor biosynthesis protein [Halorussus limi]UPV75088.1 MogA/MoaB family molybdenum cofactor biosynthesis protein [Halorussus limi]